jgi:hypothetical protein
MRAAPPQTEPVAPVANQKSGQWRYAKDLIFCISLAHLCVIKFWDEVQDYTFSYFRREPADLFLHGVTLIHTALLAIVFWCALEAVRRSHSPRARVVAEIWLVLTLVLIPLNTVRKDFLHLSFFDLTQSWPPVMRIGVVALLALAGAYIIWRYSHVAFATARATVWILVPLLPVTLVQTVWLAARENPADFNNKPVSPVLKNNAGRVVVAIFDELDLQIANAHPPELHLPEWDRLRTESFYAERTDAPAAATKEAIPGLSIGRQVEAGTPKSANTLLIRPLGESSAVDWKETNNLFSAARQASLNVGISGWYHPYCRLFGDSTVSCYWTPARGVLHREESVNELDIPTALSVQFRRLLLQIPGLALVDFLKPKVGLRNPAVRKQERLHARQEYRSIHEHALRLVTDPAVNVTYLHYPIPHMLSIFDRKTMDFSDKDTTSYFDNLLLVDRTIGDIRRALTAAGLWDQTTLLVTADHPMRVAVYRSSAGFWNDEMEARIKFAPERHIPYVIKLAGQHQPVQYSQPFDSTVSKELVLAMAARQISTPEQLVAWFDANRSRFPRRKKTRE